MNCKIIIKQNKKTKLKCKIASTLELMNKNQQKQNLFVVPSKNCSMRMLCGNGVPAEFATTSVVSKLKLNTPQNTKCYSNTASSKKATKKATVLSAAKPKTLQDPTINRAGGCGEQ